MNSKKIIDITDTLYYDKVDSIFTLRNDYFMCPPFYSYKILDDYGCGIRSVVEDNHAYSEGLRRSPEEYDKNHIVIKTTKHFYDEKNYEGAGHKQYHDISFITHGKYEIRIQNLRTNQIQTYIFVISS
jgi:hypothetical protein